MALWDIEANNSGLLVKRSILYYEIIRKCYFLYWSRHYYKLQYVSYLILGQSHLNVYFDWFTYNFIFLFTKGKFEKYREKYFLKLAFVFQYNVKKYESLWLKVEGKETILSSKDQRRKKFFAKFKEVLAESLEKLQISGVNFFLFFIIVPQSLNLIFFTIQIFMYIDANLLEEMHFATIIITHEQEKSWFLRISRNCDR